MVIGPSYHRRTKRGYYCWNKISLAFWVLENTGDVAHVAGSEEVAKGFTDPLLPDMVEVRVTGGRMKGAQRTDHRRI